MVKTAVEDLVAGLGEAFQEAQPSRGWKDCCPSAFERLDQRVRAAVGEALKTPEAFDKYCFFSDKHYVSDHATLRSVCW